MNRAAIARLTNGAAETKPTYTPETAAARVAGLMADRGWASRYIAGGAAERAEMASLNAIVAGVSAPTPAGSSQTIAETRLAQLQADPEWRGKYLAGDIEARSEFDQLVHVIAAAEDTP